MVVGRVLKPSPLNNIAPRLISNLLTGTIPGGINDSLQVSNRKVGYINSLNLTSGRQFDNILLNIDQTRGRIGLNLGWICGTGGERIYPPYYRERMPPANK